MLAALPPPVAMVIGQTILRTIYEYRLVCGDENANATEVGVVSAKRSEAEAVGIPRALEDVSRSKRPRVEVITSPSIPFRSGQTQQKLSSIAPPEEHPTPDTALVGVAVPGLAE